ncbi:MAG: protein translocase subunit SecD [Rickettsiales bacterium]|jgi:protein-export membrane protein SecD|nr:protein translocase subunit SecD [Rickettsiales bacterium]
MLHFPRWKIITITAICLMFVVMAIPTFIPEKTREALPDFFPKRAVNLGLDLQGGSHLLLEVDYDAFLREQMNNLADEIRASFREARIGYRGLSQTGGKVVFSLRDAPTAEQDITAILNKIESDLEISQNDLEYSVHFNDRWIERSKQQVIEQSLQIVSRRIDETGTKEPIIQRQGMERILLQVPGLADPEQLKRLLGRTAKMTFHMVDESISQSDVEAGLVPPGTRILSSDLKENSSGRPNKYAIQSRVMLSGDLLVEAHASYDQQTGEPVVAFRFNNAGARKFAEITTENTGKLFAIVLDNKIITAPVIRTPILGGSGIISGSFTTESANDLALLLRAGALPAPLKIIEERSVGPSLGADSIEAGTKASIIGISLVVFFMILFYGLFGLFANIAMIVNAFMTIALLAMFQATLTLPGIAGIVLTVGMAVDANVLIYERMREEIRNGKSPYAAVEDGFRIAFGTIFDSHVTTLLAALILFQFGSGAVKGFAVTLGIGVTCSLFTAVLVTRLMVVTWLRRTKPKALPL